MRYKGIREPVPSSYGIDPFILLNAQCIALIHARITWISYKYTSSLVKTLNVSLKNPKAVAQDRARDLRSDSQWSTY
jgi:hypothetical protein